MQELLLQEQFMSQWSHGVDMSVEKKDSATEQTDFSVLLVTDE